MDLSKFLHSTEPLERDEYNDSAEQFTFPFDHTYVRVIFIILYGWVFLGAFVGEYHLTTDHVRGTKEGNVFTLPVSCPRKGEGGIPGQVDGGPTLSLPRPTPSPRNGGRGRHTS